MTRVAAADPGENAVVVEPVVGIVQVELAVFSVAVQVHDATVAVRVLPRNVRKVVCATASRYRARNLEADSSRLNRMWNLPVKVILQLPAPSILNFKNIKRHTGTRRTRFHSGRLRCRVRPPETVAAGMLIYFLVIL